MKVSYKVMMAFWLCLARLGQSTHSSSVWLGVMQKKVILPLSVGFIIALNAFFYLVEVYLAQA